MPKANAIICLAGLAALTATAGCRHDPFADGRYWRQPAAARPGRRPMAATVGVHGETMDSGVGRGFEVSNAFSESGSGTVGRAGLSADSGVWPNESTRVGTAGVAAQSRTWLESNPQPGVQGESAHSSAFRETSMRTGTTP